MANPTTARRTAGKGTAGKTKRESGPAGGRGPAGFQLRPLGDRAVIRPGAREETTKSGIVIPDTVKEKPQEGTILAVGPGRFLEDGSREQMDVKTGDKVLYAKYAGSEFKLDGEDLLIVSQKDILAIVSD